VHEQFGRQLGRHVDVPGLGQVHRDLLGPLPVADGRPVHPDGAREQHPAALLLAGGLEYPRGALHVQPDRSHRVRRHVVHVGRPGQMEDRGTAGQGARQPVVIEQVQLVIPRGRVAPARGDIDHMDLVTRSHQVIHHMGADETTAPNHRDLHALPTPRQGGPLRNERVSSGRGPRLTAR
jgi:hypothetical protein